MSQLIIESFQTNLEETERLTSWVFETIRPYLMDRVLQADSGEDAMTRLLIESGTTLQLNARSESQRDYLREQYKDVPLVRGIHRIDFSTHKMEVRYKDFQGRFATVLAFNDFINRGFFEKGSIHKAGRFLMEGGHLITIGVARDCFFPGAEQDAETLKKYNYDRIKVLLGNFQIMLIRFFDWNELCFLAIAQKPPVQ